jgi:hypothetical protein
MTLNITNTEFDATEEQDDAALLQLNQQEVSGEDLRYECEHCEPFICICEPMCSGKRQQAPNE